MGFQCGLLQLPHGRRGFGTRRSQYKVAATAMIAIFLCLEYRAGQRLESEQRGAPEDVAR